MHRQPASTIDRHPSSTGIQHRPASTIAWHRPASIINQRLFRIGGTLFSRTKPGVIYSAKGVKVRCVYATDGATRQSTDGCKGYDFCGSPTDLWCGGKPHRPEDVSLAATHVHGQGYNEIILDSKAIEDHLPSNVEGFFFMKGGSIGRMKSVRDRFVRETSRKGGAAAFPVLQLDLDRRDQPFSAWEE